MTTPTAAPPPSIADPLPALVGRAVPLVLVGWLLGGWIGLAAAAAGVASTFRRPVTLVAAGAPLMLVVAALATVIEEPIDDAALRSSFATDRPTAAAAGLIAALFALIAVVTIAVRDRPSAPVQEPAVEGGSVPRLGQALALAPLVGVVLAAVVALALLAPAPPGATRDVATNLRNGVGWGVSGDAGLVVDGTEPPLAVVVAAVAPGGARAWTALAGAAAVAAVAGLVGRRRERRTVLLAAGLVALGLVLVRADLAAALVAVATAIALSAGDPAGRTPGSAAWAGAAYGLAVLAAPVLVLALPLVVAALVLDVRTREVRVTSGLAGLAGAAAVVAPWLRWVHHEFGTWSPAAELRWPVRSLAAVALVVVATVTLMVATRERDDRTDVAVDAA